MRRVLTASLVLLFILCMNPGTSFSGRIYKWVDENGVVHFTDSLNDKSVIKNHDVRVRNVRDHEEPSPEINGQLEEMSAERENRNEEYQRKLKELQEYDARLRKKQEELNREVQKYNAQVRENDARQKSSLIMSTPSNQSYNYGATKSLGSSKPVRGRQETNNKQLQRVKQYNTQVRKENAARQQEYERQKREYNRQLQEYNERKKAVDALNAKVKKHNAKIESQRRSAERKKSRNQYHNRGKPTGRGGEVQPYMHNDYPDMMYHQSLRR